MLIERLLLQRKAKGHDLLDMICQSMNLLEKDYFGLIYEDRYDARNWLDLDKRIAKFIKSTGCLRACCYVYFSRLFITDVSFISRRAMEV